MNKIIITLRNKLLKVKLLNDIYNTIIELICDSKYLKEIKIKNKDKKKVIVVLKREKNPGSGLCALINEYLGELRIIKKKNFKAVIDLKSYKNALLDKRYIHKKNGWNDFFESVDDIELENINYKENSNYFVYTSYVNNNLLKPNWELYCLNNRKQIYKFKKIFDRYIRFNDKTRLYINKEYKRILDMAKGKKICGVLLRGTDYANLKPPGHPIQPSIDIIEKDIKKVLIKYNCEYIFLACEDENICCKLKHIFGDKLLLDNGKKYSNTGNKNLAEIQGRRQDDRYFSTLEYIATLYILSKCNCLLAGRTSASPTILMLNDFKYEYYHFYDLGVY